jgi:hypothetical protein
MIAVLTDTAGTTCRFAARRPVETNMCFTALFYLVLTPNTIKALWTDAVFKIRMRFVEDIHNFIRKLLVYFLKVLDSFLTGTAM